MITAPSSADRTITDCADAAPETADSTAPDRIQSAVALSAGPNKNPSSDIALNHAKRRARWPSGVCSATSAKDDRHDRRHGKAAARAQHVDSLQSSPTRDQQEQQAGDVAHQPDDQDSTRPTRSEATPHKSAPSSAPAA